MATLSEHAAAIQAAIEAARADGFSLALEDGDDCDNACIDLEERKFINGRWRPVDWVTVVDGFH